MSAYALPGSFFFPSTLASPTTTNTTTSKVGDKSCSNKHDLTSSSSQSNRDYEALYKQSDLLVSIKSASVDPIRLIQGLTTIGSSTRQTIANLSNTLSEKVNLSSYPSTSDEQWGEYCEISDDDNNSNNNYNNSNQVDDDVDTKENTCLSSPSSHSQVRQNPMPAASKDSHDDAIQFTLSISFNGRKYTATRPLPSFIKLRNDLMMEISRENNRKSHTQSTCRKALQKRDTFSFVKEDSKVCDDNDHDNNQEEDVFIPEVPVGSNKPIGSSRLENGAMAMFGMAGRGFRGLQETVCTFCPPMEKWIQNVATLVPSSPVLANFLWEPIHNNQNDGVSSCSGDVAASSGSGSGSSGTFQRRTNSTREFTRSKSQTLNAIHEDTNGDSDSDDCSVDCF